MTLPRHFPYLVLILTLIFTGSAGSGAVSPLTDPDPQVRTAEYQRLREEIQTRIEGAGVVPDQRHHLDLQLRILEKLEALPDSLIDHLPVSPLDKGTQSIDWETWTRYLDYIAALARIREKLGDERRQAEQQQESLQIEKQGPEDLAARTLSLQSAFQERNLALLLGMDDAIDQRVSAIETSFGTLLGMIQIPAGTVGRLQNLLDQEKGRSREKVQDQAAARAKAFSLPMLASENARDSQLLTKRYEALQTYETRLNQFSQDITVISHEIRILELSGDLLWVGLMTSDRAPGDLILPNEDLTARMTEQKKALDSLLDQVIQVKTQLLDFKAQGKTLGPKAMALYDDLALAMDRVAVEITALQVRASALIEKDRLFFKAVTIRQSAISSTLSRAMDALGTVRKKASELFGQKLFRLFGVAITPREISWALLLLFFGGLLHWGGTRLRQGWKQARPSGLFPAGTGKAPTGLKKQVRDYQEWLLNLKRRLYFRSWFPHVPLGLVVGGIGFFTLWRVYGNLFGLFQSIEGVQNIPRSMFFTALGKFTETSAGIMLIFMATGLFRRSRFAWFVTTLISLAMAGVAFRQNYAPPFLWVSLTLFISLLAARRHFERTNITTGGLFALSSTLLFLVYGVLGSFILGQDFSPPINDLISALYFTVVTMSTVGYGEIIPRTMEARLFVISLIILGITLFTTAVTTVIAPMVGSRLRKMMDNKGDKMNRSEHVILTGNTFLAHNTYEELKRRNVPVTLILPSEDDRESFDDHADIVIGDPASGQVLDEAGVKDAQTVMALGDDDSENAFIVLAAKESKTGAKTVCAVNEAKNLSKVRMVYPDMLIAPQIIGGELLAMAVAGEKPDPEGLIQRLLASGVTQSPADK